ncbi:MAG: hypothetical protein KAJ03_07540 [Gammaproteobacteria bacterium]|nr:hypothetical protein [Gammaproteobacteria bacterium]
MASACELCEDSGKYALRVELLEENIKTMKRYGMSLVLMHVATLAGLVTLLVQNKP